MAATTGNGSTTATTAAKKAKGASKAPKAAKGLGDAARDLESSVARALRSEIKDVRRLLERLHDETDQALARLEQALDGDRPAGKKSSAKKAAAKRPAAKKAATSKASPGK